MERTPRNFALAVAVHVAALQSTQDESAYGVLLSSLPVVYSEFGSVFRTRILGELQVPAGRLPAWESVRWVN